MPSGVSVAVVRAESASGSGFGLGQRERADQLAIRQSRQISLPLFVVAEVDDRQRADAGVGAERSGERRQQAQLLADARGADLVETEAAVGFRNLEAREVAIRRLLDQLARQGPVLGVDLRRARHHFRAHELFRGAPEEQLLFGQVLAGEDGVRGGVANQEPAAAGPHFGVEASSHWVGNDSIRIDRSHKADRSHGVMRIADASHRRNYG